MLTEVVKWIFVKIWWWSLTLFCFSRKRVVNISLQSWRQTRGRKSTFVVKIHQTVNHSKVDENVNPLKFLSLLKMCLKVSETWEKMVCIDASSCHLNVIKEWQWQDVNKKTTANLGNKISLSSCLSTKLLEGITYTLSWIPNDRAKGLRIPHSLPSLQTRNLSLFFWKHKWYICENVSHTRGDLVTGGTGNETWRWSKAKKRQTHVKWKQTKSSVPANDSLLSSDDNLWLPFKSFLEFPFLRGWRRRRGITWKGVYTHKGEGLKMFLRTIASHHQHHVPDVEVGGKRVASGENSFRSNFFLSKSWKWVKEEREVNKRQRFQLQDMRNLRGKTYIFSSLLPSKSRLDVKIVSSSGASRSPLLSDPREKTLETGCQRVLLSPDWRRWMLLQHSHQFSSFSM